MIRRAATLLGAGLAALQLTALAQEPPVLVSPDVRVDRTVVFRFWAPMASEVQLGGDWMLGPPTSSEKAE